ncbi:MAG: hypothetical protein J3R72DRAFT_462629 [Linnemannia gamsii]|nr:MAG: hypothetical protein J3R72DRAFT_462629 [Linnemannia gamsii]
MSEYWKSNAKFFCRFCKIYITDNKSTRNIHDQGSKHKENVERFLRETNQRGRDREAESARMDKQMDAIEKAAMKQYQLDVEAGLVQPSTVAQKGATAAADATTTKTPAKDLEPTPTGTGLLKVTASLASMPSKEKEDSEEGKEDTESPNSEPVATAPPVKAKDETIGQPGEWETVEAPVHRQKAVAEDEDEDVAGNPEDLKRFKIVEKTYPVDNDDDFAGEDGAGGGSAVFKKRKGGVGKPRNIRRKL